MRTPQSEWHRLRAAWAARRGLALAVQHAWGKTPDGRWVVLPAMAETRSSPDKWWLGFDEELVIERAAGAALLCRTLAGDIVDFGIPPEMMRNLAPQLSLRKDGKSREFAIVRRGHRYLLHVRAADPIDITNRLGEFSWLASESAGPSETLLVARDGTAQAAPAPEIRFFARYRSGCLEPLDATPMAEGATYQVVAFLAERVPAAGALRRILAAAKPSGLPRDLAERHDYYAHGTGR